MQLTSASFWRPRLRAAGLHLTISLLVAALAAALVLGVWYPFPYREISGGRELFVLVVTVDVIMGPLITLAIFNLAKPRRELVRDLGIIGALQLAALCYGLWTVAVARPVYMVFELDRFRAVHAIEVPPELLDKAPPGFESLPWDGPGVLAVRPFRDTLEGADATMAALNGLHLGARPDLWTPIENTRQAVLAASQPISALRARFPNDNALIDEALGQAASTDSRVKPDQWRYLPMVGRKLFWTAVVHPSTGRPVAYLPLDSF